MEAGRMRHASLEILLSVQMLFSYTNYEVLRFMGVISVWSVMFLWLLPRGGARMRTLAADMDIYASDALGWYRERITRAICVTYRFMVNIDINMIVIST